MGKKVLFKKVGNLTILKDESASDEETKEFLSIIETAVAKANKENKEEKQEQEE